MSEIPNVFFKMSDRELNNEKLDTSEGFLWLLKELFKKLG